MGPSETLPVRVPRAFSRHESLTASIGLGVAVLLANWTRSNLQDPRFARDARSQLAYLTDIAPRTWDGAISHRASQVQLW